MSSDRVCSKCGAEIPASSVEVICAACLDGRKAADAAPTVLSATVAENPGIQFQPSLRYFGDYELIDEIARGGMGIVYKARQVSLNRFLAVKMILSGRLAGADSVKRFHREAEAAASLKHPNIVAIHEIGEEAGQHFFSMDLVEGPSLAQKLRAGPLTVGEAIRIIKTVAQAVHFAHERGVIHRDLKPGNVLLDPMGQPHLTDFGLATRGNVSERLTQSGALLGTPAYAAPEQVAGRHDLASPASDIYSLGAILYEMLTGEPPFTGDSLPQIVSKVLEETPPPPSALNPRVPRDLDTITLKCLEKRPNRRYDSCARLAADLERLANHEPISAVQPVISRRFEQWFVKHPGLLMELGFVLLLSLVWTIYNLWSDNRFLSWEKGHPGQMREPTFWSDADLNWVIFLAIAAYAGIGGLERMLRIRQRRRILEGVFASPLFLGVLQVAAVAAMVLGAVLGMGAIETRKYARHAVPHERRHAEEKIQQAIADERDYQVRRAELARDQKLLKTQELPANHPRRIEAKEQIERETRSAIEAIHSSTNLEAIRKKRESHEIFGRFDFSKVRTREAQAKSIVLLCGLGAAVFVVSSGRRLFGAAFREQRFAFYASEEEEQVEKESARDGVQKEAGEKAHHIRGESGLLLFLAALLLFYPYYYWVFWLEAKTPAIELSFFGAEAGGLTLGLLIGFKLWLSRKKLAIGLAAVAGSLVLWAHFFGSPMIAMSGAATGFMVGWTLGAANKWLKDRQKQFASSAV